MWWRTAAAVSAIAFVATAASGQLRRGRFGMERDVRYAKREDYDGSFQFCRVVFRQGYGDGGDWSVDFPRADENLSIRLSELTKTPVGQDAGVPRHLLVSLREPETLSHCPFIMMTEVGSMSLDDVEAANLRTYLLKGGFLWADDFWGEFAWSVFEEQIRRVLPRKPFPIIDLPITHPMFTALGGVRRIPQIPSITFWAGSGGRTSERGADSATPHARAILDDHGRAMVFITHNTDLGDAFEREGDSRAYFLEFSVEGYALGVNVLLYAMSH
jgi:hypothetical protein